MVEEKGGGIVMKKTLLVITVIMALSLTADYMPTGKTVWAVSGNMQNDPEIIAKCCFTVNTSRVNEVGRQMECRCTVFCTICKEINPTITWNVKDAGTTGAVISGDTLFTETTGTVTVTAIIVDSTAIGNYTQDFKINVQARDIVIIRTATELDAVRSNPGKFYRLGNDIDLKSYLAPGGAGFAKWGTSGWMPISDFTGVFDGNGYKITGLWIDRCLMSNVGLFGNTELGNGKLPFPILFSRSNCCEQVRA